MPHEGSLPWHQKVEQGAGLTRLCWQQWGHTAIYDIDEWEMTSARLSTSTGHTKSVPRDMLLASARLLCFPTNRPPILPLRRCRVTATRVRRPEDCFQAAALPKERLGTALNKEQVLSLKLSRLQRLMERFPATLWAKRAGLLSGVLLLERNPAMAIQFLRTSQRDFPVLDDYIRLWTGEALLNLGDAKQAADMFESIPQAVPDSSLLAKAAYRAGEAWYQASSCPEATAWFAKAVELDDKEPGTPQAFLRRGRLPTTRQQHTERSRDSECSSGSDLPYSSGSEGSGSATGLKSWWRTLGGSVKRSACPGSGISWSILPYRGNRGIQESFLRLIQSRLDAPRSS